MNGSDEAVNALRAAIKVSPDNVPLRKHLADTLLMYGRAQEAEVEYREALTRTPADVDLKIGLADAYFRQGRTSPAIVILEEIVKAGAAPGGRGVPAKARIIYARALLKSGDHQRAASQYRAALETDPAAADPALAESLGVTTPMPERDVRIPAPARDEDAPQPTSSSAPPLERPAATFRDVGGMDKVKDEVRMKIIYPMTRPELYKMYGKTAGGGILMYGPPGCGKTHLARATAGEVKARFMAIGISDVLNMWMGESERNLHELFDQARTNKPCVLFFDEVDALGASRADLRQSAGRQLVNQFLNELDGVSSSNEGLLVLAATNAPWHIDSAFRRPGRFDRVIFVPPPDEPARAAILSIMLTGKPTDGVDADAIARKTDGFSGADLKAVVDTAIEAKLKEAMRSGVPAPLSTKDLLAAAKSVKPSTREWFAAAKNHALYANQGGVYDDVLDYMKLR